MSKDVLANVDLTIFPEIALLIFAVTFVAIAVRTWRSSDASMSAAAELPLEEGVTHE